MFIIETSKEYDWPVVIELPDNGGFKEVKFTAKFKKISKEEYEQFSKNINDYDISSKVLIGWNEDEVGAPFNEENKAKMLDTLCFPNAIALAFLQSVNGILRKN